MENKKRQFFDHNLETSVPVSNNSSESILNDPFDAFGSQIKLIFEDITEPSIKLLYTDFQNSKTLLDDATNAYLDKPDVYQVSSVSKPINSNGFGKILKGNASKFFNKSSPSDIIKNKKKRKINNPPSNAVAERDISESLWRQYIGTFNMPCWCTRSIYGLKSVYVDNVIKLSKPTGNNNAVYVIHAPGSIQFKREMGRLAEEVADFIGPLIADGVVEFECKLFFVENEKLRTGDTFVIRADCYLCERGFRQNADDIGLSEIDARGIKLSQDGNSAAAGTKRRTALLELFKKLELKPIHDMKPLTGTEALDNEVNDSDEFGLEELERNRELVQNDENEFSDQDNKNLLTLNQVKDLYKSTELNDLLASLPESIPSNFILKLRPYQRQGLSWMLQREKEYDLVGVNNPKVDNQSKDEVVKKLKSIEKSKNPLWKEYRWPKLPERFQGIVIPDGLAGKECFYVNLYNGSCSLEAPMISSSCIGGILADEMGLGKTITTLSLVLTYPKDVEAYNTKLDNYAYGTTLIILPMALLTQWEREFQKVVDDKDRFRCFIYYGYDTLGDLGTLLRGKNPPTIVLTTYGTVQSEWSKLSTTSSSGLFSVKFLRIILDEGHNIRNRLTKTAKAVNALNSSRRWILTGTPIINRLDDLFSLAHFLKLNPWSDYSLWKQCISLPFDTGKGIPIALDLLKSILDPILLRRTKNQKDRDGNYLVILPPKEVEIEKLKFNPKEEAIYNWLKAKAVNSFKENFRSGMVFKNYSSILTQLLRLRQVCCHVDLIKIQNEESFDDLDVSKTEEQTKLSSRADDEMISLINSIEKNEEQQRLSIEEINFLKPEIYDLYPNFDGVDCAICTGPIDIDTCVITECKHCFCLNCLTEHFDFQAKRSKTGEIKIVEDERLPLNLQAQEVFCPMCREQLNKNRLLRTVKVNSIKSNVIDIDLNELLETQQEKRSEKRDYFVRPFVPCIQSSKINALLLHLEQIREDSPGEHVIVFSQFTSFLDIVEVELQKYTGQYNIVKFDGRLNLEQRQHALNNFEVPIRENEDKLSILLLSLKAGGVGLNLTVASKAFLMDPHWNNAIEFQAIDRLHRVGQTKTVKAIRFIMENSIEERMLAIQARKNQLGEALTMNDDERRKRRIEELQSLIDE